MSTIGIRELARNAGKIVNEVESTGQSVLVTRHGRPVVAIVALDVEAHEDLVLAKAPEFVRSMLQADEELKRGTTRPLSALIRPYPGERAGHLACSGASPARLEERRPRHCPGDCRWGVDYPKKP